MVGRTKVTRWLGVSPLRHCGKTFMAFVRALSTLIKGQCPSIMRNCMPQTRVAIRKARLRAFRRTQKALSILSRRMRPSLAPARSSKDSLVITIATFPTGQNQDKNERVQLSGAGLTQPIRLHLFLARRAPPRCPHCARWCLWGFDFYGHFHEFEVRHRRPTQRR